MSKTAFLKHIALTGDIPRIRSAKKYKLNKTEFVTYYQEYLKMHSSITFQSMHTSKQNHLVVLMLHFSGQPIFYEQCYRYEKARGVMIDGIQQGEIPSFENVLSLGLKSEEFERAFIKWGKPNLAYTTLRQHYKSMQNAELLAIEECKNILNVSACRTRFPFFFGA